MMATVDYKRVTRYPPEVFLSAQAIDLSAGDNVVADYYNPDPYVIALRGFAAGRVDGLSLTVLADDQARALYLPNLGVASGIQPEDYEVKIVAFRQLRISLQSPSATTAYPFRYRLMVDKPNLVTKLAYGQRLSSEEEALARKYKIQDLLQIRPPEAFNPTYDIQVLKVEGSVLSSSGVILDVKAPIGKKLVLLDITAETTASSREAAIIVERDHVERTLELDPTCLPPLDRYSSRPENFLRVVALDYLRVSLDARVSGTYRCKVVYGIAPVTISDKIKWGNDLTGEEKRIAAENNLEEKLRVGVM